MPNHMKNNIPSLSKEDNINKKYDYHERGYLTKILAFYGKE